MYKTTVLLVACLGCISISEEENTCINDCSSMVPGYGNEEGTSNFLNCSIEIKNCNARPALPPLKPAFESSSWYRYKQDTYDNLALNFSWSLHFDDSIKDVVGFEITVMDLSQAVVQVTYFCIHTQMDYYRYVNSIFYYDCFGVTSGAVKPGATYEVSIVSLPYSSRRTKASQNVLRFTIIVPSCASEDMKTVELCIPFQSVSCEVEEIFCENKSIEYSYFVHPNVANTAVVHVCESEVTGAEQSCLIYDNLPTNATLYNLTVPTDTDPSGNYSITVSGKGTNVSSTDTFTFATCGRKIHSRITGIIFVSLLSVLLLVVIVFFCARHLKQRKDAFGSGHSICTKEDSSIQQQICSCPKYLKREPSFSISLDQTDGSQIPETEPSWTTESASQLAGFTSMHADMSQNHIRQDVINVEVSAGSSRRLKAQSLTKNDPARVVSQRLRNKKLPEVHPPSECNGILSRRDLPPITPIEECWKFQFRL